MIWSRWMTPALIGALAMLSLALCDAAWAMRDGPYTPVPQAKPCQSYWDGAFWHRRVREHKDVVSYVATRFGVVALLKNGSGFMAYATEKGCVETTGLHPLQVRQIMSWMRKGWTA